MGILKRNIMRLVLTILAVFIMKIVSAQMKIHLLDQRSKESIFGVHVTLKASGVRAVSDKNGAVYLDLKQMPDTLTASMLGYRDTTVVLYRVEDVELEMLPSSFDIDAVEINTGYFSLPKERATGSYNVIDAKLLARSPSGNILERIDGLASGLQFKTEGGNTTADIRIRGVSTIESNEKPLIILDNFPYDGDISAINPNDIANITVLKDAAASSIWGARAGNGVLVITTKRAQFNEATNITIDHSYLFGSKPDLFYSPAWLPSKTVMEIEQKLFERGGYVEAPQNLLTPFVELLIKQRDNEISDAEFRKERARMETIDSRQEASDYLYRPEMLLRNNFQVSTGGAKLANRFSVGYDALTGAEKGNTNKRLVLNMVSDYRPLEVLSFTLGTFYSKQRMDNNGIRYSQLYSGAVPPYLTLKNLDGTNGVVGKNVRLPYAEVGLSNGLLDWRYRPLDEIGLADNRNEQSELRLDASVNFQPFKFLRFSLNYQVASGQSQARNYYAPETYYVRNMVNRFTQADGTRIIPYGGILDVGDLSLNSSQAFRLQSDLNLSWATRSNLVGLLGAEIRENLIKSEPGYRTYDYKEDLAIGTALFDYTKSYPTRPLGLARILEPPSTFTHLTDRFLSYYTNWSYTYDQRYIVSGSARWDGSNLFGVNANQRGNLLWSSGLAWNISNEQFYQLRDLPYLKARVTYGVSGNVNNLISARPTLFFGKDEITAMDKADLMSIGNPFLSWESVATVNLGADFGLRGNRLSGSLEYYIKNSNNLIGDDYMDPTTGLYDRGTRAVGNYKINYASMKTKGVDFQLMARVLQKGTFSWNLNTLFSYVRNSITDYNTAEVGDISYFMIGNQIPPVLGRSRDVVYSLPWYGLSAENGYPLVLINGELSQDYVDYYNSRRKEDLIVSGVSVAPYFGSVRNVLSYRNVQLDFMITWKAGHVVRRSSMEPGAEFSRIYHEDYFKRWEKPGDERYTSVPAYSDEVLPLSSAAHPWTTVSIEPASSIRLRDVGLNYTLNGSGLPFKQIRFSLYARNLGVLWQKSDMRLDPDFVNSAYPPIKSLTFGLTVNL